MLSFNIFKSKTILGILTGVGTLFATAGISAATIGQAVTIVLIGVGFRDAVAKNGASR